MMKPRVLIIITGDPRTSPRPAEAVRIAAGLGASGRAEITVYLRGQAVRALAEPAEALVDEDNFTRYWPLLAQSSRPIYVQPDAMLPEMGTPAVAFAEMTDAQLTQLAAEHNYVLRF
jgi:hypothetical protein